MSDNLKSRRERLIAELAEIDAQLLAEAQTHGPAKHNHKWDYTVGYRPLGECVRCDQLRAEKQEAGETPHNHGKTPYGRPVAKCPRCVELAKGAQKRPGFSDRRW